MEELAKRQGFGEEIFERKEFQKKVKNVYENELLDENWNVIEGNNPLDQITFNIMEITKKKIWKKFPHLLDSSVEGLEIEIKKLFINK